jgi:hypothetical protein
MVLDWSWRLDREAMVPPRKSDYVPPPLRGPLGVYPIRADALWQWRTVVWGERYRRRLPPFRLAVLP